MGNCAVPDTEADFRILGAGGGATIPGWPDFVPTTGPPVLLLPSQSTVRQLVSRGA